MFERGGGESRHERATPSGRVRCRWARGERAGSRSTLPRDRCRVAGRVAIGALGGSPVRVADLGQIRGFRSVRRDVGASTPDSAPREV
eukprot:214960-Prymnesium_polylepis.2